MPTGSWWFQELGTVAGIAWDSSADNARTTWLNADGIWQVQTPENYWTRTYLQTAPLHDSREFDYVWYGQGDSITGERVFGWKSYLHKDSEHEPICIPKEIMEEVL